MITWCVCTYGRPNLLARTVRCFKEQTYEDRYMVILDDGGQYGREKHSNWEIVSYDRRFQSLGAKRNFALTLVPPGTDCVMPVDDDDIPLPHHTEATAAALAKADWSRPSVIHSVRELGDQWIFIPTYTGNRDDQTKNRLYHPAMGFRLANVLAVGGYPEELSGPEDQGLMRKLEAAGTTEADPVALGFAPSYGYKWGESNISGMLNRQTDPTGSVAWQRLERVLEECRIPHWEPPFDLRKPMAIEGPVQRRPF